VVLLVNEPERDGLVNDTVDDNARSVDGGGRVFDVERRVDCVIFCHFQVPPAHSDLSHENQTHEEQSHGETDEDGFSPLGSVDDFPRALGVCVNVERGFELGAFSSGVLEVTHQPLVRNHVLLSLPALNKDRAPESDEDGEVHVTHGVK